MLAPALFGASSFACADVVSKVVLKAGADVLTMATVRGLIGLAVLFAWLQLTRASAVFSPQAKWFSLALGIVFGANVFLVFKAIELVEVPIAILTYFVYPLLTGIAAAFTGLERFTLRGLIAAVAAF